MLSRPAILITSLSLLICCNASAQHGWLYTPLKDDPDKLRVLQTAIRKQYEQDSAAITGDNKKYILEIYRDRFKQLNELFDNKEPLMYNDANLYLTGIANEIISKNPELKKLAPRFVFSRAWWPNAYSTGEGTIVFNIDLFARLKNESQAAFVICHELAHLYFDHSNKKISKYINTIYSDEYQQKLKDLKKQKYDRKSELDKLEMGFAFKSFRHSREFESEADSAALRFIQNTGYDYREALSCLALLDEIDEVKTDFSRQLPQLFTFTEYPFRKRWIEKEAAFFGVTAENNDHKKLEDSLKTHPDCKARIKLLETILGNVAATPGRLYLQPQQQFNDLQQQFTYEEINFCFTSKHISRALFNAILLLEQKPGDVYLITTIGNCFNEFYEKQKTHHLNNIVDNASPFREKNYNVLLEFISRLSLTDISHLGYYFLKKHSAVLGSDAAFAKTLEQAEKNFLETKSSN